jgi:hypothetical protein
MFNTKIFFCLRGIQGAVGGKPVGMRADQKLGVIKDYLTHVEPGGTSQKATTLRQVERGLRAKDVGEKEQILSGAVKSFKTTVGREVAGADVVHYVNRGGAGPNVAKLRKDLKDAQTKADAQKLRADALDIEVARLKAEKLKADLKINQLETALKNSERKSNAILKGAKKNKAKAVRIEAELKTARKALADLDAQHKALEDKHKKAQDELTRLIKIEDQLKATQDNLATAQAERKQATADLATAQASLENAQKLNGVLRGEVTALKLRQTTLEKKAQELEQEATDREAVVARLTKDLQESKEAQEQLEQERARLSAEVSRVQRILGSLTGPNGASGAQITPAIVAELEREKSELQEKITKLKKDIVGEKKLSGEIQKQREEAEAAVATLEEEIGKNKVLITETIDLISETVGRDPGYSNDPTVGNMLGQVDFLVDEYKTKKDLVRMSEDAQKLLEGEIKDLKKDLEGFETAKEQLKQALKDIESLRKTIGVFQAKEDKLKEDQEDLRTAAAEQLKIFGDMVEEHHFYRSALARVKIQSQQLGGVMETFVAEMQNLGITDGDTLDPVAMGTWFGVFSNLVDQYDALGISAGDDWRGLAQFIIPESWGSFSGKIRSFYESMDIQKVAGEEWFDGVLDNIYLQYIKSTNLSPPGAGSDDDDDEKDPDDDDDDDEKDPDDDDDDDEKDPDDEKTEAELAIEAGLAFSFLREVVGDMDVTAKPEESRDKFSEMLTSDKLTKEILGISGVSNVELSKGNDWEIKSFDYDGVNFTGLEPRALIANNLGAAHNINTILLGLDPAKTAEEVSSAVNDWLDTNPQNGIDKFVLSKDDRGFLDLHLEMGKETRHWKYNGELYPIYRAFADAVDSMSDDTFGVSSLVSGGGVRGGKEISLGSLAGAGLVGVGGSTQGYFLTALLVLLIVLLLFYLVNKSYTVWRQKNPAYLAKHARC